MRTYEERIANIRAKVSTTKKAYRAIAASVAMLAVLAVMVCAVAYSPIFRPVQDPSVTNGPALEQPTQGTQMDDTPVVTAPSDILDPDYTTIPTKPFDTMPTAPLDPIPTQPQEEDPTEPFEPEPTDPPVDTSDWVTVYCVIEVEYQKRENEEIVITQCNYDQYGNLLQLLRLYDGGVKILDEYTYDERGNCLTAPNDQLNSTTTTYTYDDYDRMLSESWEGNGGEKLILYFYDENGNLTRKESYTAGKLRTVNTMTYDTAGRVLSEVEDHINNTYIPDLYIYWEYDASGNLLSYHVYYDDVLRNVLLCTYDDAGRLTVERRESDGELIEQITYTYDTDGRLIREDSYHRALTVEGAQVQMTNSAVTYEYDENGYLLHVVYYEEDIPYWWQNYDAQGNLLSSVTENSGTIRTYDEFGNRITQYSFYENEQYGYVTYTYASFLAPPWMVEQILAQQEEYLRSIQSWC